MKKRLGGSLLGVWNGWGYGIAFFGLWNFKVRSLKFGQNRSFWGIAGIFLPISALKNNFRTQENGHPIRHQSIPPLSAGRKILFCANLGGEDSLEKCQWHISSDKRVAKHFSETFRVVFSDLCLRFSWAELKGGGGGKTYRKAKPREDGPSEAVFGGPPKTVSEVVTRKKILGISKGLSKRNGIAGSYFYHTFYVWFSFLLENKAYLMSGSGLPKRIRHILQTYFMSGSGLDQTYFPDIFYVWFRGWTRHVLCRVSWLSAVGHESLPNLTPRTSIPFHQFSVTNCQVKFHSIHFSFGQVKVHSINVKSLTNCQVTSHSINLRSLNSAQVKVHSMHLRSLGFSQNNISIPSTWGCWVLARPNSVPSISGFWPPWSSQHSRQTLLFELHNSQSENSTPWIRSLWFLHVMTFWVTPTPNPKIYMWFYRVWFSFLTLRKGYIYIYRERATKKEGSERERERERER